MLCDYVLLDALLWMSTARDCGRESSWNRDWTHPQRVKSNDKLSDKKMNSSNVGIIN